MTSGQTQTLIIAFKTVSVYVLGLFHISASTRGQVPFAVTRVNSNLGYCLCVIFLLLHILQSCVC